MLTLVVFILILSLLVLVHEFGHYIVAKIFGVRVEEFGLGLPPRLFGKKIGETDYTLNVLPFGGFVKLTGEDAVIEDETACNAVTKDPKNFMSKNPIQRLLILCAGVFMNLVLALFLSYLFLAGNQFKTLNIPVFFDYHFQFGTPRVTSTMVSGFKDDGPAELAGVQLGEVIVEIDGKAIYSVDDIKQSLKDKTGNQVSVTLLNKQSEIEQRVRTVSVMPSVDDAGVPILGVYLTRVVVIEYNNKVLAGPMHAYNMLAYSTELLGKFISMSMQQRSLEPVSSGVVGPVGIYSVIGSILDYSGSSIMLNLLNFVSLMSLSLAFLNIMPLPALDGGRVFFIFAEMLLGKRVNPHFEVAVHKIGMVLLLGLLLVISIKDVFVFLF